MARIARGFPGTPRDAQMRCGIAGLASRITLSPFAFRQFCSKRTLPGASPFRARSDPSGIGQAAAGQRCGGAPPAGSSPDPDPDRTLAALDTARRVLRPAGPDTGADLIGGFCSSQRLPCTTNVLTCALPASPQQPGETNGPGQHSWLILTMTHSLLSGLGWTLWGRELRTT